MEHREGDLIDIDKFTVDFECPKCGFYNPIFLKQARLRDVIICRGCKANIQLDDQMNECRKATRQVKRSLKKLEDSLGDLEITINL